jgi:MoaA/NifB/PqqE/SkfB family radical SAM enzyme
MHPTSLARTARFFSLLAVKEHVMPQLHVRPLVAELFLTDNCNLKCVSCACWRTTTREELSTGEWRGVLDQLAELGIIKVNLTGGEPLLRRDAPELISYALERGIRTVHVNTNATLLDPRRREAVLAAGARSFNISVDGPDATTHEGVRGVRGSFDLTMRNLRALIAERERLGLRLHLNFTVLRSNVGQLPRIARLAQELQVKLSLNLANDHTFLFRHADVARAADVDSTELDQALTELEALCRENGKLLPRFSELRYLRRHFTDVVQRDVPCAESQLKLMIHSTGETGGCWGHDPEQNVRTASLRDIVDDQHYRRQHAKLYRKECVGCGSNYALNLRWRPRSYVDDALWRLGRRSLVPAV